MDAVGPTFGKLCLNIQDFLFLPERQAKDYTSRVMLDFCNARSCDFHNRQREQPQALCSYKRLISLCEPP